MREHLLGLGVRVAEGIFPSQGLSLVAMCGMSADVLLVDTGARGKIKAGLGWETIPITIC